MNLKICPVKTYFAVFFFLMGALTTAGGLLGYQKYAQYDSFASKNVNFEYKTGRSSFLEVVDTLDRIGRIDLPR